MPANPLFELETRHFPLPLDRVRPEHFPEAVDAAIAKARGNVHAIAVNPAAPDFANTLEALEASDEWLDRISSVFFHLLNVDAEEKLQALSREIPPKLSEFQNDVVFNRPLFERIRLLHERAGSLDLNPEQCTVLENHWLSFRRNGALLSEADQARLREIDRELSRCGPHFAENVLKATRAYALWVSDSTEIDPLPASAKATAKAAARQDGRGEEWKFTLDVPSYNAFLTYAPNPELRRQIWEAYNRRCLSGDFDNLDLIRQILDLRSRRARLLGYRDHAHYVLERRMASDLETVRAFYDRLLPVVMPAARRDLEAVAACMRDMGGEGELQPWDYAYYAEKLRKQKYDLEQEALRPWFAFESTLRTIFDLGARLFQLEFLPVKNLPVNHPEVRCYQVISKVDGAEIGSLLIDPFPRDGKRPGAWMGALLGQGLWDGETRRPCVTIVCNFTPPVDDTPSLLTLDEARTLFHEFGHALHELLSECRCRSVAGTHVFWDFVELPSQLMENWLLEPEFLRETARHYQSGEALDPAMIDRIQAARRYQKGFQAARQLSFGLLDLAWHTTPPDQIGDDLIAFERDALREVRLFPPQPDTALSPSFQHIFAGGYAAGYYSYKWAEVLEADVFETFTSHGLFHAETASRLRAEILSKGGSRHPLELFRAFRGRDPDPDALLRRDGLLPVAL